MTAKRDIGDFTTDDDGERDGKELVATIRETIQALWGFHAGTLQNVSGTNSITATVAVTQGFTALTDGLICNLIPANTNTGAVEINIAGLGVKSIKQASGDALEAGALVAGTQTQIIFNSDNDYFVVNGSSGTTEVTVNGGLQVKRSEITRMAVKAGPATLSTSLMSRSFQCTYSTSRVIVEGTVSRISGVGTDDDDGVVIALYKDGALIEEINDAVIGEAHAHTPFYFSHLPADTDAHTYEVRASSTISTEYAASSTWLVISEITPN